MSGLKISKKEEENSQNLIRRFRTAIQKSGILLEKRKRLFKKRKKSKSLKKESTLRRLKKKEEFRRLKKLGKL